MVKVTSLTVVLVSALLLMSGTDSLSTGRSPFQDIRQVQDMGMDESPLIDKDMAVPLPVLPLPFEPVDECTCPLDRNSRVCYCLAQFSTVKYEVPYLPKEKSLLIVKKKYKPFTQKLVESSDKIQKDLENLKQDLMIIRSHYEDGDVHHDECK